ncbi:RNA polymerase sigma factor [Neobacillus mesonae]|nr:RNA polymerase sigma factor [Neobacillus mesonae]
MESGSEEKETFEDIVKKYQHNVYRYCCLMLRNKNEAEDAAQEIFIKAYINLEKYRYNQSFEGWLFTIAVNHCRTVLRKQKRRRILDQLLDIRTNEASAEALFFETDSNLLSDFHMLSSLEKTILVLHTVEMYSLKDIASIVGMSPSAVRKKYERMKNKIIKESESKGEWSIGKQYKV